MNEQDKNVSDENKMSHIKGWGIDADPKNDPTYPMQDRKAAAHESKWDRPPQQPVDHEVLHSIERPDVTAVYGTAAEPSGLSGMIRRYAFKHGEGTFSHWLPLILADRVNSVEGILDDLRHGKITNICAESGLKAQWKHNRPAVIKKAAVTATVVAGVVWWLKRDKK